MVAWLASLDSAPSATHHCPPTLELTGRFRLLRGLANYEWPLSFRYSDKDALDEAARTGSNEVTVRGKVDLHPMQRHTGSGNRYSYQWIESLPLIVLAGLR